MCVQVPPTGVKPEAFCLTPYQASCYLSCPPVPLAAGSQPAQGVTKEQFIYRKSILKLASAKRKA